MVREPQGAHRGLWSWAPGDREIKFTFSWLWVRVFSFFVYLASHSILEFTTVVLYPHIISVSGLQWPKWLRILLIHTFIRKNGNFFIFSVQQASWNASSSMIDNGYSKQMSEKKTNCVCLQLASQQSCTEEAKPRESRPRWKYNILLTYPRTIENKQGRTAQLEETKIWLKI